MANDVFHVPDAQRFARMRELWSAKRREKLLRDLANLNDAGSCKRFWEAHFWLDAEPDQALLRLRDELRNVWGNLSASEEVDGTLRQWLGGEIAKGRPAFVPYDPLNTMVPNPWNLRVTLAFAVLDSFQKLGTCGNPKCPRPYFFRSRAGQQFCNRKACLTYGQREHKLRWWHTHRGPTGRASR